MVFLPQPHGATCTEQQSCAMVRGRGREILLAGALWRNVCTEQALSVDRHLPAQTLEKQESLRGDQQQVHVTMTVWDSV